MSWHGDGRTSQDHFSVVAILTTPRPPLTIATIEWVAAEHPQWVSVPE